MFKKYLQKLFFCTLFAHAPSFFHKQLHHSSSFLWKNVSVYIYI